MSVILPSDDAETRQFYQQLCHYPHHVLRMTYEYFQEDLIFIVENWRSRSLLSQLSSRNIPDLEKYKDLEHDRKTLARDLLQEIFGRGAEAVITLWVSLHVLRKDHGSPVLDAVLEELWHRGEDLPGEILLDEEGHNLPPQLRAVKDFLQVFTSLDDNNLSDTSCTQLAYVIRNNPSLKILVLSSNHLYGPHFTDLMEALICPTCKIEELHLSDNDLPDTSCIQLASVIRNNRALKMLVLSDNHLAGPHLNDLMDALSSPDCRIEELHLDNNNLQETFCIQLISVIKNNQSLKRLVLSDNRLSGPHLNDLMEALSSSTCKIEELCLAGNDLSDSSFAPLASGIRNNKSLQKLFLTNNRLSGPHFSLLLEALSSPGCRMEELHMRLNGLSKAEEDELNKLEQLKPHRKIFC